VRRHALLSRVLPRGHRAYRFPGGKIYLDLRDSPRMLERVLGVYEVPKTNALRRLLKPGMTFLDIGANHGDFSLLAARFMGDRGRVLAFEPAPDNATWVRRSIAANKFTSIDVHEIGLGDAEGEAELLLAEHSGWHSFVATKQKQVVATVTVRTRRLDDVLAEQAIGPVDVIKLDVEGFETQVLAGASETLKAPGRRVLLLDLHPPIVDPVSICADLRSMGYTIHDTTAKFRPLDPDARTRNVVAIKDR
jgi:FkbM family methyltransferase